MGMVVNFPQIALRQFVDSCAKITDSGIHPGSRGSGQRW